MVGLLAWTGVLASDVNSGHSWRAAGSGLVKLFGQELSGKPFAEAWPLFDGYIIERALAGASERLRPFVARLLIVTRSGNSLEAEILALPVETRPGGPRQVLCGLFPAEDADWIGHKVAAKLELTGLLPIDLTDCPNPDGSDETEPQRTPVVLKLVSRTSEES